MLNKLFYDIFGLPVNVTKKIFSYIHYNNYLDYKKQHNINFNPCLNELYNKTKKLKRKLDTGSDFQAYTFYPLNCSLFFDDSLNTGYGKFYTVKIRKNIIYLDGSELIEKRNQPCNYFSFSLYDNKSHKNYHSKTKHCYKLRKF